MAEGDPGPAPRRSPSTATPQIDELRALVEHLAATPRDALIYAVRIQPRPSLTLPPITVQAEPYTLDELHADLGAGRFELVCFVDREMVWSCVTPPFGPRDADRAIPIAAPAAAPDGGLSGTLERLLAELRNESQRTRETLLNVVTKALDIKGEVLVAQATAGAAAPTTPPVTLDGEIDRFVKLQGLLKSSIAGEVGPVAELADTIREAIAKMGGGGKGSEWVELARVLEPIGREYMRMGQTQTLLLMRAKGMLTEKELVALMGAAEEIEQQQPHKLNGAATGIPPMPTT